MNIIDATITGIFIGAVSVIGNYLGEKYLLSKVKYLESRIVRVKEHKAIRELEEKVRQLERSIRDTDDPEKKPERIR